VDAATGDDVPVYSFEEAPAKGVKFDGRSAALQVLVKGLQKGYLRAWPVPNAALTVELQVFRLPEDVGAGDELEIDAQHHRHLLLWVKHLAYGVQDSETYDGAATENYRQLFEAYCANAMTEQSRLRRRVSVVAYGGL
jgi:hypothetical protein